MMMITIINIPHTVTAGGSALFAHTSGLIPSPSPVSILRVPAPPPKP